MKILIAEDQQVTRLVLMTHLSGWGHQVTEAGDGQEALELLTQDGEIDLVVTDLGMPRLDGLGLTRKIREIEGGSNRRTYIILLTGHSDISAPALAPALEEVDDYMVKPFEAAELRQRLKLAERLINAERRATAGQRPSP